MDRYVEIRPEVRRAFADRRPVVALESAVLSHGLPPPANLDAARRMRDAVRAEGAVAAVIAVLDGRAVVGLSEEEIAALASTDAGRGTVKASRSDIAPLVASRGRGATTVAATARIARRAGIAVIATGGIGGVHRGGERTLDISADLVELARTQVAVVCAGAKAILDLPRTREALETLGVPIVGYGTDEMPAFWSRESGLRLAHRVDSPGEAALAMDAQWSLGMGAIVFAVPPPARSALPLAEVEAALAGALDDVGREGVTGQAVTPWLLDRLGAATAGRTVEANLALLEENARVGARIAAAYASLAAAEE